MASASLRALLSGLIDYAGLFPPAGLSLADVVENYATYRRSDDQWALGRLVVPAARLDELVTLVPSNSDRWPVSALVGENVEADAARIAVVQGATEFVVQSAEVRATSVEQVRTSVDALSNVAEVYVEVPLARRSEPGASLPMPSRRRRPARDSWKRASPMMCHSRRRRDCTTRCAAPTH
jgi:hypothetical protein